MSADLRFPYADATEQTLRTRLVQVLAIDNDAPNTREVYADAIKASMLEQVVCGRVNGRCCTFAQYHSAVYGLTIDGKQVNMRKP